jgi:low temperature requirement protein LtrA
VFIGLGMAVFVVEFLVPVWAEKAGRTAFHRHHIVERYGLLTIIVLGEVLLAVAMTFGSLFQGAADLHLIKIGVVAMIVVFSYWWIYFAEPQHLVKDGFAQTFVWGYGHLFIFASIALMGAGLAAQFDLLTGHSKAAPKVVGWFIGGPLAMALLALWVVRDRYMALGARRFALPVGAVAVLTATALTPEPLIFAALMVAILLWRVPMTPSEGHHP